VQSTSQIVLSAALNPSPDPSSQRRAGKQHEIPVANRDRVPDEPYHPTMHLGFRRQQIPALSANRSLLSTTKKWFDADVGSRRKRFVECGNGNSLAILPNHSGQASSFPSEKKSQRHARVFKRGPGEWSSTGQDFGETANWLAMAVFLFSTSRIVREAKARVRKGHSGMKGASTHVEFQMHLPERAAHQGIRRAV
jgi:hypothetical protein